MVEVLNPVSNRRCLLIEKGLTSFTVEKNDPGKILDLAVELFNEVPVHRQRCGGKLSRNLDLAGRLNIATSPQFRAERHWRKLDSLWVHLPSSDPEPATPQPGPTMM